MFHALLFDFHRYAMGFGPGVVADDSHLPLGAFWIATGVGLFMVIAPG